MNPKEPLSDDARSRILTAATRVFSSIGFAGARVDQIAELAGINKAMLYYHVGGKEALYAEVLTSTLERGIADLRSAVAAAESPEAKLRAVLHTLARFGSGNPSFVPLVMREIASGGEHLPDAMLLRMSAAFHVVAGVLAEGVEAGVFRRTDPLLTHVTIVGSVMFLVASAPVRARVASVAGVEGGERTPEQLADHAASILLDGLLAEPVPRRPARRPASAKPRGRRR